MSLPNNILYIATKIIPIKRIRNNIRFQMAKNYFQKYKASIVNLKNDTKQNDNEKIFSIWFQGENHTPKLVQSCFDSIRRNCSQDLLILDSNSLYNYIDLPGVIVDKYNAGKIGKAAFSDIARIELLHNQGGFWMDATVFALGPIPDGIVKQDFFAFLQSADSSWSWAFTFVISHFLRARKGSYLIKAWRELALNYWRDENTAFSYFWLHMLFKALVQNDDKASFLLDKIPQNFMDAGWDHIYNQKFDPEILKKIKSHTFMIKTSHKKNASRNPIQGSFADFIINNNSF